MYPIWLQLCMLAGSYRGYVDSELHLDPSIKTGYFNILKNSNCTELTFTYGSTAIKEQHFSVPSDYDFRWRYEYTDSFYPFMENFYIFGYNRTSIDDQPSGLTCSGSLVRLEIDNNKLINVRVQLYNVTYVAYDTDNINYYRDSESIHDFLEIYDMEKEIQQKYQY